MRPAAAALCVVLGAWCPSCMATRAANCLRACGRCLPLRGVMGTVPFVSCYLSRNLFDGMLKDWLWSARSYPVFAREEPAMQQLLEGIESTLSPRKSRDTACL